MTVFEMLKSKNIDEMADWLNELDSDWSLWTNWFDSAYCKKCDPVYIKGDNYGYGWCEFNNKCKYFQDMKEIPDNKQTIKLWLESEYSECENNEASI